MIRRAFAAAIGFASLASCGYHVGGKADLMPKSVQTIAIPAFSTLSTRYRLTDTLPQEIGREFTERTRFRIVQNPGLADAVLNGSINTVVIAPNIFDPGSGKATMIQATIVLTVNLVERSTGRVLYSRPNWAIHENYQVAVDPHQFFDESGPAFERLGQDAARDIVSSIVENF
jgi:hypothetical protein